MCNRRRGWRQVFAGGAFGLFIAGAILPCAAHAQDDAELRRIFEQILQDPGNPGLNLRYARLAVERGEIRKALAAYERILAQDPGNEVKQTSRGKTRAKEVAEQSTFDIWKQRLLIAAAVVIVLIGFMRRNTAR